MDVFGSAEFRLLRFSARYPPKFAGSRWEISTHEVTSLVEQMMVEGYFAEEFVSLLEPDLRIEEMMPFLDKFLKKLEWRILSEEQKFRFLTGLYASIGKKDDVSAYYSICNWMDDVGGELSEDFSDQYVADKIGAERIYGSFYSSCPNSGQDFIATVNDPTKANWDILGDFRPRVVFRQWLENNPHDFEKFRPIDPGLLGNFI